MQIRYIHFFKQKNEFKDLLIKNGQSKWLDIGCSTTFTENFTFTDILDESEIPKEFRERYFKLDIRQPLQDTVVEKIGKFDLIRMQHVFEHFTPEEGLIVLKNCDKLLNENGYLLVSVPDLDIFINRYKAKELNINWPFKFWANTRIALDAPQSFYFSIYTHSVPSQSHLWCYDKIGLMYQIQKSGAFKDIVRIGITHRFFNFPFTHNRPLEDLCILAKKK